MIGEYLIWIYINKYVPLEEENRTHVSTDIAAYHLNRRPQTLRSWACMEDGPIRPIRINGRLAWSIKEIIRILKI